MSDIPNPKNPIDSSIPAEPVRPAAPASPAQPSRPAAPNITINSPAVAAQANKSFEELAEDGDHSSEESPSIIGVAIDAIAAAVAIAFTVLLALEALPFLS
ncbi:MAG: hypothetical protein ACSHYA_09405 [Opitutaceae bacterium]